MRLWRWIRGGHWERYRYGDAQGPMLWFRVRACTAAPTAAPPALFCKGRPTCEDHGRVRF